MMHVFDRMPDATGLDRREGGQSQTALNPFEAPLVAGFPTAEKPVDLVAARRAPMRRHWAKRRAYQPTA